MYADTVDSHRTGSRRGAISKKRRNKVRLLLREGNSSRCYLRSHHKQNIKEGSQGCFTAEVIAWPE